MIDVQLFLGFLIDSTLAEALKHVDENILSIFVGGDRSDYLQDIEFQGMHYLGKFVGEMSDSAQLGLLKENICSLLTKIVPQYPSHDVELVLFPVSTHLA